MKFGILILAFSLIHHQACLGEHATANEKAEFPSSQLLIAKVTASESTVTKTRIEYQVPCGYEFFSVSIKKGETKSSIEVFLRRSVEGCHIERAAITEVLEMVRLAETGKEKELRRRAEMEDDIFAKLHYYDRLKTLQERRMKKELELGK